MTEEYSAWGSKKEFDDISDINNKLNYVTQAYNYGGGGAIPFGDPSFTDIGGPGVSVKPEFTRQTYEFYRGKEVIPRKHNDIIAVCLGAYEGNGIVRNVIDLMSDFASRGISIHHEQKSVENFFRSWFDYIGAQNITERFLSVLYRAGIAPVWRVLGTVNGKDRAAMLRSMHQNTVDIDMDISVEVPTGYSFLNPMMLDIADKKVALLEGKYRYLLKLSRRTFTTGGHVEEPIDSNEGKVLLPSDFPVTTKNGQAYYVLDDKYFSMYFYKKDDWDLWPKPMIFSIIKDILLLDKNKLADMTALDSAINNIRLWKLGKVEKDFILPPAPGAARKLSGILQNQVHGGTTDIIWTGDIELEESKNNAFQFLGKTKYDASLQAIYAGLGIPPTLTGSSTQSGFTNNFISIKTLIERLEYGRSVVLKFWNDEIREIMKVMNIKKAPKVKFERMTLSDEKSEKALLLQLADRSVISHHTLLERFGEDPTIEMSRIKREERERKSEKRLPKAGPFYASEKEHEYKKLALQKGLILPEDVGLQSTAPVINTDTTMKGTPGQGRPLNSTDKTPRKTREAQPIGASRVWFAQTWNKIYDNLEQFEEFKALGENQQDALVFDSIMQVEPNTEFDITKIDLTKSFNYEKLLNFDISDRPNLVFSLYCSRFGV